MLPDKIQLFKKKILQKFPYFIFIITFPTEHRRLRTTRALDLYSVIFHMLEKCLVNVLVEEFWQRQIFPLFTLHMDFTRGRNFLSFLLKLFIYFHEKLKIVMYSNRAN